MPAIINRREVPVAVTVLVENAPPAVPGLGSEHGLAFAVTIGERLGLFDCGQSALVAGNAAKLGIDLGQCEWIALSHGHYDHTGGLPAVLAQAPGAVVHAHPAAFERKLIIDAQQTPPRYAGMPLTAEQLPMPPVLHAEASAVCPQVMLTGQIPRHDPLETVPARFVVPNEDGSLRHDSFPDDQSLILETPSGTVVLLGCCHAGVVNTLEHIRKHLGVTQIRSVVGGMHLHSASEERIRHTAVYLKAAGVQHLHPIHCTGETAVALLQEYFGEACQPCPAGTVLKW